MFVGGFERVRAGDEAGAEDREVVLLGGDLGGAGFFAENVSGVF